MSFLTIRLTYIKESENHLERGHAMAESHVALEKARRILCLSVEITHYHVTH
jgi:hypothetical protein